MANNLQTNTSGLDCEIKDFQTDLYNALDAKYSFAIEGHPRAYKNPNENGDFIPEVWNESKQEYQEVYLDSSIPYRFFFIEGENHTTEDGSYFIAPLKVVFMVDLRKLDTLVRADAEAQKDAAGAINTDVLANFEVTGIEKGMSNVFSGFNTDAIRFDDLHPWHVFAITGNLGYYLAKNC